MATILFANDTYSTLAAPITNVATTCNLAAGSGAKFPNPGAGQLFKLTFADAATGNTKEIVNVTARSGDTLTIVRGQEGTSAAAWNAGDHADGLLTAGAMGNFLQTGTSTTVFYEGIDNSSSGSPNAVNVPTLVPAHTGTTPVAGDVFLVQKSAYPSTGAVTFQIAGGTSYPVTYSDGTALQTGAWPANTAAFLYFAGGSNIQFLGSPPAKSILAPPVPGSRGGSLYDTAGTYNFTVPANVFAVFVQVLGGGGGGGAANGSTNGGTGGGAGGQASRWFAVNPGDVLAVVLGAGGAGGSGGGNGTAGATTSISGFTVSGSSVTISGPGGGPGSSNGISGGSSGKGINGQSNTYGGGGGSAFTISSYLLGGTGGGSFFGSGGLPNGGQGAPAGVGGAGGGNGQPNGGAGKDGFALILY